MKKLILLILFAFACKDHPEGPPKPVELHLGEDVCSACGMIISDERFGAQQQNGRNSTALFDDFGCLLKNSSEKGVNRIFVRSFEDSSWIPAEHAFAVSSSQIHSPMGYGIATFATEEASEAYAARFRGATVREVRSLLEKPVQK